MSNLRNDNQFKVIQNFDSTKTRSYDLSSQEYLKEPNPTSAFADLFVKSVNVNSPKTNSKNYKSEICGRKVEYQTQSSSDDDADVVIEKEEELCAEAPVNVQNAMVNSRPKVNLLSRIEHNISHGFRVMIIMRGLPGSGKSYMARSIVHQAFGPCDTSQFIFSTDDFFMVPGGGYNFNHMNLQEAHHWNQKRVWHAAMSGLSPIIVDNTNTQTWEMLPYGKLAVENGYFMEVLEPRNKWSQKPGELARRNIHGVPKFAIERMLDRYEPYITGYKLWQQLNMHYLPNKRPPQMRRYPPVQKPEIPRESSISPLNANETEAEEASEIDKFIIANKNVEERKPVQNGLVITSEISSKAVQIYQDRERKVVFVNKGSTNFCVEALDIPKFFNSENKDHLDSVVFSAVKEIASLPSVRDYFTKPGNDDLDRIDLENNDNKKSVLTTVNALSLDSGEQVEATVDNISQVTWKESPFPISEVALPQKTEETRTVPTAEAGTNTCSYDFKVAQIGAKVEPPYKILPAFNRNINENFVPSNLDVPHQAKLMLHKGSMTDDVNIYYEGAESGEHDEHRKDRIDELVEMFPRFPRDFICDIYEKVYDRDFNWTVEYLIEAVPEDIVKYQNMNPPKLDFINTISSGAKKNDNKKSVQVSRLYK